MVGYHAYGAFVYVGVDWMLFINLFDLRSAVATMVDQHGSCTSVSVARLVIRHLEECSILNPLEIRIVPSEGSEKGVREQDGVQRSFERYGSFSGLFEVETRCDVRWRIC